MRLCEIYEYLDEYWKYSRIRGFYWKLRHRLFDRFDLVRTGLSKWSYCDKVVQMEYAIFSIVDDFVSKDGEDAFGFCDWDWDNGHIDAKLKIINALHYHHIRRKERQEEIDKLLEELYGGMTFKFAINREFSDEEKEKMRKLRQLEVDQYNDRKETLKGVIDVIGYLWT